MTPTYATQTDFEAYVEGWDTDNPEALARLLERAERDIDALAVTMTPLDSGLKFDPEDMTAADAAVLMRATCAQAEYRFLMGEEHFAKAQFDRVGGPDFTTEGRLPYIGPKVFRELAGTGVIPMSTTTGPTDSSKPPWYGFAVNDPAEV